MRWTRATRISRQSRCISAVSPGLPLDAALPDRWLANLAIIKANSVRDFEFAKTPRDLQVEGIERYEDLAANWTRRANEGSLLSHYQTEVVATFDPGEPKFTPEPGKTYFYENVGTTSSPSVLFEGYKLPAEQPDRRRRRRDA